MKTTTLALILILTGLGLRAQTNMPPHHRPRPFGPNGLTNAMPDDATPGNAAPAPATPGSPTDSSSQAATPSDAGVNATPGNSQPAEEMIPAGNINFQGVDVSQVLDVYAKLVGRTLLRAGLPSASIILKTETPLTRSEAIQALQAVLALNGISVVNIGDKFVKVLTVDQANTAGAEFNDSPASELPDLGAYVTHIVQLRNVKPSVMMPILTPFAKLPNAIVPIDDNGILVLRDNAENVKRMLQMIDRIDVSVPAEYISEVIPIKYAMADDIASALNSLGGTGGGTVSIGSSTTQGSTINGVRGGGAAGGQGINGGNGFGGANGANGANGYNGQQRTLGSTANGTPSGGASSFQQRLQNIIQRASTGGQQDQIQIFGQTKIIADDRSNSLLVFATRPDMERIKEVIAKLDVLLSQVLIESVIIDVELDKALQLGVSAAQNPKVFNANQGIAGGGGSVNGPGFLNFLNNATTNGFSVGTNSSSIFGNALSSGLSYFGNIGPTWDVALAAAASDDSATVIQRPRIQTSQAKAASFFVGQTVPYVTGSTYGSAYGNSSSYSQLSVGVELDVTPFINPDGLVVMDINQEIDDISGSTTIQGVGDIPDTDKRTLSSEIAVKDRDTVMLGGFVRSEKSNSKSGVPFLQDIPLLGNLFTQRNDSKKRTETIVLIRPTVLRTPELAAAQAKKEESRLPGIAHAEALDNKDELKQVQAEEKAEQIQAAREAKAAAKAAAKEKKLNAEISAEEPPTTPAVIMVPAAPTNAPASPMPTLYVVPAIPTNAPPKMPAAKPAPVVPVTPQPKPMPLKPAPVISTNKPPVVPAKNTSNPDSNPAAGLY